MGGVEIAALLVVGVLAGVVSVIAGGAGILVYPGLVFLGLTPIEANATAYVALSPACFAALWVDRKRLPALTGPIWGAIAVSFVGCVAGGVALLATGEALFRAIVPALLGLATLTFWRAPELQRRFARHGGERFGPGVIAGFFLAAAYSGYFGTGYGVALLAVLRLAGVENFVRANHLKNIIAAIGSIAGAMFFLGATSLVSWPHALVIIVGNIAGGVLGARLAHVLPAEAVRRGIIAIGAGLTLVFAWRFWIA